MAARALGTDLREQQQASSLWHTKACANYNPITPCLLTYHHILDKMITMLFPSPLVYKLLIRSLHMQNKDCMYFTIPVNRSIKITKNRRWAPFVMIPPTWTSRHDFLVGINPSQARPSIHSLEVNQLWKPLASIKGVRFESDGINARLAYISFARIF